MSDKIKSVLEQLATIIVEEFKEQDDDSRVSNTPDEDVVNEFLETALEELDGSTPVEFLAETASSLYEDDDPDSEEEDDDDLEDEEQEEEEEDPELAKAELAEAE